MDIEKNFSDGTSVRVTWEAGEIPPETIDKLIDLFTGDLGRVEADDSSELSELSAVPTGRCKRITCGHAEGDHLMMSMDMVNSEIYVDIPRRGACLVCGHDDQCRGFVPARTGS